MPSGRRLTEDIFIYYFSLKLKMLYDLEYKM
jgi:hypothetical protein